MRDAALPVLDPGAVHLGIGADHLDELDRLVEPMREVDPLLARGGHRVHRIHDHAAAGREHGLGQRLGNEICREAGGSWSASMPALRMERSIGSTDTTGQPSRAATTSSDRGLPRPRKTHHRDEHRYSYSTQFGVLRDDRDGVVLEGEEALLGVRLHDGPHPRA